MLLFSSCSGVRIPKKQRYNTLYFSELCRKKGQLVKRFLRIFVGIFVALFIIFAAGFLGYSGYIALKANDTLEQIHIPIVSDKISDIKDKEEVAVERPISILLLGLDGESGIQGSRSDAIILMTMNPKTNKTTLLSIPRDTRTEIIGKGKLDKINHAHAFGGPQMTIDTVENLLNVDIDYFASVNMKGFKDTIDVFNGVTVINDFEFSYDGHYFPTGEITLNGEEALAFARMRKEDPRGDLGRNERQKQIISSLMSKAASISSVTKAEEILDIIGDNVRTNAQLSDIKILQQIYSKSNGQTEMFELTGQGQKVNGIWYFIVDEEIRQQVSQRIKEELTPAPSDEFTY